MNAFKLCKVARPIETSHQNANGKNDLGALSSVAMSRSMQTSISIPGHGPAVGSRVRCRQIGETDVQAVTDLLSKGFQTHPRRFWSQVLLRLGERSVPGGFPKYGYLLECDGSIVGAVLLIFSMAPGDAQAHVRCNVSSWLVQPDFRAYASLLAAKALRYREVTYLNITPAPHTFATIRALGYFQYSQGIFVAAPALQFPSRAARIFRAEGQRNAPANADPLEHELLVEHAGYGCLSLWCEVGDEAYPFVFRLRAYKGIVRCAQLVYCRSVNDFVRLAGSLGRFLAIRGRPLVVIDSNGPITGLVGKYFDARMPRFFKGPNRPRLGDLAYTEAAIFGM